jgi:hypothetical protein
MTGENKKASKGASREVTAAISAILSIPGAAWVQAAQAQTESARSEGVLQEVIVTATRRSERLQDVPESITAFDSQDIAIRGLQQMDDYARLVPGLAISQREPGGTTIVFRGVTTSGLNFGSVASSALYLDEQPITSSGRNPDPRLIDIERVEALRGPQGSLYGASSQSGTLRVITNKANAQEFDAWAEAQLSSTSDGGVSHDVSAMVNVPLVQDKLAVRLVGFSSEDAGFIDRVLSDSPGGTYTNASVVDEDVNTVKTTGGRASLHWNPADNVNATLGVVFQDVKADGHGDITRGAGDLKQVRFEEEGLDDKWYQMALTLNAGLSFGDLVVSASYFDRDFRYEADATDYEFSFNQNAIAYDSPVYDFGGDPRGFATNHEETRITTFEARLAALTEGAALLLVGQHALQRGHLRGERGDVFLRRIDDREPFVQPVEILSGLLGGILDRLADAVGDGVQPLREGLLELRLPVRQHVAHGAHQPGGLGLQPAEFGHVGLVLLGFDPFGLGGLFRPPPAAPDQHDRHTDGGSENEGANRRDDRDHKQRVEAGEAVPDQGENIHGKSVSRFAVAMEQKGNIWLWRDPCSPGKTGRDGGAPAGEGGEAQNQIDRAPRNN